MRGVACVLCARHQPALVAARAAALATALVARSLTCAAETPACHAASVAGVRACPRRLGVSTVSRRGRAAAEWVGCGLSRGPAAFGLTTDGLLERMEALLLLKALRAAVLLCRCSRLTVRCGRPGRGRQRRGRWCALELRRHRTVALCGAKLKRGGAELREPTLVKPRDALAPFQEDSRLLVLHWQRRHAGSQTSDAHEPTKT